MRKKLKIRPQASLRSNNRVLSSFLGILIVQEDFMEGKGKKSSYYWLISNLLLYVVVISCGIWVLSHAAALDAHGEFNLWLKLLLLVLTINVLGTIRIVSRMRHNKH
jgi:hypothetical protein